MSYHTRLRTRVCTLATFACINLLPALPQGAFPLPDRAAQAREAELDPLMADKGAGRWRETPVDVARQSDDVSPEVRELRNKFWQRWLPPPNDPVTGPWIFGLPEIPSIPNSVWSNAVWVVARFTSYKVFEPSPGRGAYTEYRLQVERVLGSTQGSDINPGSQLDVDDVGGTLVDRKGNPHSYHLLFDHFPFQIQHTYLLMLSHEQKGDFYEQIRKWDISSGRAIPCGDAEAGVYIGGRSQIGGKPASQAIGYVSGLVAERR